MRVLLVVMGLLAVAGCGPGVDFAGTYTGDLAVQSSCSGSSMNPESWTITQTPSETRLKWLGGAGSTVLTVSGATATLTPGMIHIDQPPQDVDVVDGTLALAGSTLTVAANIRLTPPGCNLNLTGALKKP